VVSVSYLPGVARHAKRTLIATLMLLTLTAASAGASSYSQVLKIYEARGHVPPCQFSSQQLASALKGIDTYGAQYFADFSTAVQTALQKRAAGACAPASQGSSARSPGHPPTSIQPLHPGPLTQPTSSSLPAPLLILAILAALGAVGGLVAWLAWWRGWGPAWAYSWRHMWSEAGLRAGTVWEDFSDWRRSGTR
jgi:hypothetical protein